MADHFNHILDDAVHVDFLFPLNVTQPRKVEQSLSDPFTAKGLVLNPTQVGSQRIEIATGQGLRVSAIGRLGCRGLENWVEYSMQSGFERLRTPGDSSQWIVDFMRHPSGEEPHARQLFIANHFGRSLSNFLVQVALNVEETLRTVIDGLC